MNWTGGNLSRHSRIRGGALTAHQKQHFAKVQAATRIGARKGIRPLKWSSTSSLLDHHRQQSAPFDIAKRNSREETVSKLPPDPTIGRHSPKHRNVSSSECQDKHNQIHLEPGNDCDGDLYNAVPEAPSGKRKQRAIIEIVDQEGTHGSTQDRTLEKRRRILAKKNWVGITVPNQVEFSFDSHATDDKVGKRRKLTDGHKARYSMHQSKLQIQPSFNERVQKVSPHHVRGSAKWSERGDVQNLVDHRGVSPVIISRSVQSNYQTKLPRTHDYKRSIESSETMLLDNNESPRRLTSRQSASHSYRQSYKAKHDYSRNDTGRGSCARSSYNTPSAKGIDSLDASFQFSASSVPVHHPKPQSSKVSNLLRSSSLGIVESTIMGSENSGTNVSSASELANSTTAQVAKPNPVVPSSQILENNIWESWLGLENDKDELSSRDSGLQHQSILISPGVSMNNPTARNEERNISAALPLEFETIASERAKYESRNNTTNEIPTSAAYVPPGNKTSGDEKSVSTQFEKAKTLKLQTTFSNDFISHHERIQDAEAVPELDTDEVWRKFVFDDSSNDEEMDYDCENMSKSVLSTRNLHLPSSLLGNSAALEHPSEQFASYGSARSWNHYELDKSHSLKTTGGQRDSSELSAGACDMSSIPTKRSRSTAHWSPRTQVPATCLYREPLLRSSSDGYHDYIANPRDFPDGLSSSNSSLTSRAKPTKKVLLTKPKPLIEVKSNGTTELHNDLHVGQRRCKKEARGRSRRRSKSKEENYNLSTPNASEYMEDD